MEFSHGKIIGRGTAVNLGPLGKGGKVTMKPQTSGHIDNHRAMKFDAVGHEKGSRGPYTSAGKGHHKAK